MPRFPLGPLALLLATTPLAAAGPVDDLPDVQAWAEEARGLVGDVAASPCWPAAHGGPEVPPSPECLTVEWPLFQCLVNLDCCLTPACVLGYIEAATGVGLTSKYPVSYCVMLEDDAEHVVSPRVDLGAPCGVSPGGA